MVTFADAQVIAEKLSKIKGVIGIEVFGSVATGRMGNDVDLILLVEDSLAKKWWSEVRLRVKNWPFVRFLHALNKLLPGYVSLYDEPRRQRSVVPASRLLGTNIEMVAGNAVDVMLMPEGWRRGGELDESVLSLLEGVSGHKGTLAFLGRVAKQAKRVV